MTMANCVYCGKPAGFLRIRHKACKQKYLEHTAAINALIEQSFFSTGDMKTIKSKIEKLAKEGYISQKQLETIYLENYDAAVQQFLYDGILTKEEEIKLAQFKENLQLDQDLLDQHGLFQQFIKAVIIRDLAKGKKPLVDFDADGDIPFTFDTKEQIIRLFQRVERYEHPSALMNTERDIWTAPKKQQEMLFQQTFKRHPVKTKGMKFVDGGILVITDKNVYVA